MRKLMTVGVLAAIAALVLVGCPVGPSSQGVAGFAKGVITAKGSIFVNGVEYDTSGSTISLGSQAGTDADLKVGMVVSLKGTIDPTNGTGVADQVAYAKSIEGIVGSVDKANAPIGSFDVFGVLVSVDASTVYEGIAGLAGLYGDEQVEVSGMGTATGILASRVEVKSSAEDFTLAGVVSGLSGSSFDLTTEGGFAFHVTISSGTLNPGVVDGAAVEVEFSSSPVAGSFSTTADKVHLGDTLEASEGDRVEVSGVVADFAAGPPATFTVDGTSVSVPADASVEGTLAEGVEVEVRGTLSSGVLQAAEVRVQQDADSEIEGPLASVDVADGTFVLDGVTVAVDASTIFRDEDWAGHAPVDHFGVADVAAGDHLQVEAYVDGTLVKAAKIERSNPASTDASLQGLVTAVSGADVTVLGAVVDTSSLAGNGIVATLVPDTSRVKLTGTAGGTSVTWSAIELDD